MQAEFRILTVTLKWALHLRPTVPEAAGTVAILLVGLVAGAALGYGIFTLGPGKTATIETTLTTTATTVPGGQSLDLQAALNNTAKPDLAVTSYSFGKGVLTAWVLNNGSQPYVINSHVPLLNGTTDSVSSVISTDPHVVRIGDYFYVPPGGTVIVTLDAPTFLTGQTGVMKIYGDSWSFVYGTQKD